MAEVRGRYALRAHSESGREPAALGTEDKNDGVNGTYFGTGPVADALCRLNQLEAEQLLPDAEDLVACEAHLSARPVS